MSIRRPPTGLSLTASDVAEMTAKMKQEREQRVMDQEAERTGGRAGGQDALGEADRRERERKERMSRDDRVGV